jgi:hypothetical protein
LICKRQEKGRKNIQEWKNRSKGIVSRVRGREGEMNNDKICE